MRLGSVPISESTLQDIAKISGGRFYRATDTEGLEEIYAEIDELEKTEVIVESYAQHEELFAYPLVASVILILLGEFLRNTRFRRIP